MSKNELPRTKIHKMGGAFNDFFCARWYIFSRFPLCRSREIPFFVLYFDPPPQKNPKLSNQLLDSRPTFRNTRVLQINFIAINRFILLGEI